MTDQNDDAPQAEAAEAPAGDRLAAAEAEVASLKDQLLRALAEQENLRRRAERDREDSRKFAIAGFAKDLVNVAENLRRALDAVPAPLREDETAKPLLTGVEMTERELMAAFERHGVRRIDPLGQPFDYNYHQAIAEVPGTDKPAGTVVQVLQAGFVLHDRILRPAMVGVAKGEAKLPGEKVDTKA